MLQGHRQTRLAASVRARTSPCGSIDYLDLYGPGSSMNLKHQHDLRGWPRLWASAWPSLATGATDINTEPGCNATTDPETAAGSTLAQTPPWTQEAA